jgi:hypothetical protein
MDPKNRNALLASLVPIVLFVVIFGFLFYRFRSVITMTATPWQDMVKLLVIFGIAALSALGARALLTPLLRLSRPEVTASDPNIVLRSRLAPFVLALGGTAILVLTMALMIIFTSLATDAHPKVKESIDTLLLGVFGSVLPILATWVGTVIAFYFTNESYRQAAEATAAATASLRPSGPKVTERMIPYDKIGKIEVDRQAARAVRIVDIEALMKEPVTRLVLFDATTRSPIFVIRRKLYPSEWLDADGKLAVDADEAPVVGDVTVQDYLNGNGGANANDAALFGFVAPGATLEEARLVMREIHGADVFVTLTGQKTEQALGWLTDDLLKG